MCLYVAYLSELRGHSVSIGYCLHWKKRVGFDKSSYFRFVGRHEFVALTALVLVSRKREC